MTNAEALPHLLTIDQLAERRIPYLKVGKLVRFDPDEISRWLDESRVAQRPSPSEGSGERFRQPTSAVAVNEPSLGSCADDEGEEGIDRSLDRTGALLYLRE